MNQPTLVFATRHLPCSREKYGAQLRAYHVAKALQSFAQLELWIFPYGPISQEDLAATEKEFGPTQVISSSERTPKRFQEKLREHLDPLYGKIGQHFPTESDQKRFLAAADSADLVWFHTPIIPNLFGRSQWPNAIIDIDDFPSQIWEGKLAKENAPLQKLRTLWQTIIWKRREQSLHKRVPSLTVCSEKDLNGLKNRDKVTVIPNGFSSPKNNPQRESDNHARIGFIGTLEYEPNKEGVEATLRLAGRNTETIQEDRVEGLGFIDDADQELTTWTCSLVPIHLGGGTRIKIAESFGKCCPVVSTSLGAYGYDVQDGKHCLLADDSATFAQACVRLLKEPQLGKDLAENALSEFNRKWNWDSISPRILEVAKHTLSNSSSQ